MGHFSLRNNSAKNRSKPPTTLNPQFFSTHQADFEYGTANSLAISYGTGTNYTQKNYVVPRSVPVSNLIAGKTTGSQSNYVDVNSEQDNEMNYG